ncbi:MAG: Sec-independent protein translocase subunit TatA/TatB [Nitrosotalea sp.]
MTDFSLFIMGNDWIMIAFVALVLLFGTKRLPEASKKIGKIMGQFNKTKNTFQDEIQKAKGNFSMPIQGPATSERQKLEVMAKTLGIDPKDKTDDDLKSLISSKLGGPNTGKGSEQSTK